MFSSNELIHVVGQFPIALSPFNDRLPPFPSQFPSLSADETIIDCRFAIQVGFWFIFCADWRTSVIDHASVSSSQLNFCYLHNPPELEVCHQNINSKCAHNQTECKWEVQKKRQVSSFSFVLLILMQRTKVKQVSQRHQWFNTHTAVLKEKTEKMKSSLKVESLGIWSSCEGSLAHRPLMLSEFSSLMKMLAIFRAATNTHN